MAKVERDAEREERIKMEIDKDTPTSKAQNLKTPASRADAIALTDYPSE
ncbi:MAG: hypothetical protein RIE73_34815 [Coleofasciculus sp. C1-SOL-03]